jgi:hypothetical protein
MVHQYLIALFYYNGFPVVSFNPIISSQLWALIVYFLHGSTNICVGATIYKGPFLVGEISVLLFVGLLILGHMTIFMFNLTIF